MPCPQCGSHTPTGKSGKPLTYCTDRCKSMQNKRIPCADCGDLVWIGGGSAASPTCRPCRSAKIPCGTMGGYKSKGCRCNPCRDANAKAQREFKAKRKAAGRPHVRKVVYRRYSLSSEQRLAIFERDDWTCQICLLALDRSAHWNDPMAPTLDHIVPQSLSDAPDHSPNNLRAAHRRCNASRGNRVDGELLSC